MLVESSCIRMSLPKKVENGSAKASYVKAGVIDDIDIALMIHPEMKHIQR